MSELLPYDALWTAFKAGDKKAFGDIYQLYINDLLSYGYRISTDKQLVKDCVQDLFLYLWRTREQVAEVDSVKYYLYRALRNRIIKNIAEQQNQEVDTTALFDNILNELSIEETIISQENVSEKIQQLTLAIQQLPKRQQEAIQLKYYHNFSYEEIAEMMQMNNQSVRNTIHRAITELRHHFLRMVIFLLINNFF